MYDRTTKSADIVQSGNSGSRLWRRSRSHRQRTGKVRRVTESVLLVATATLILLALGELGVRSAIHAPLFEWRDFRRGRATGTINKAIQYDSLLGWRLKPFITSDGFNTLDYGIRSNDAPDAKVEPGGVLAVGSSFTVGSGVRDVDTWPAQLHRLTGWNVNNAGEGGYQADQIILLGEQLLPVIQPQVLVVDLIPGTIIGTGYASSGWPKPYFTVDNDELVAHNFPVPRGRPSGDGFDVKQLLGHLAVVDRFMAAFFVNFWFTSDGNSFVTVSTDEIGVTCRLLARLKQKTDATHVRLVLYLQYPGMEIIDGSRVAASAFYSVQRWAKNKLRPLLLGTPPGAPDWHEASALVGACARDLQIATVDEFPTLRRLYETNADEWRKYYQVEDGAPAHKSPLGNKEVAKLVAAAVGDLDRSPDQELK
jgi:hypothetical protein